MATLVKASRDVFVFLRVACCSPFTNYQPMGRIPFKNNGDCRGFVHHSRCAHKFMGYNTTLGTLHKATLAEVYYKVSNISH